MEQEIKTQYKNMVKERFPDEGVKNALIAFIETYDGTNIQDFEVLFIQISGYMAKNMNKELKAQAYDTIKKIKEEYDEKAQEIVDTAMELADSKDIAILFPAQDIRL